MKLKLYKAKRDFDVHEIVGHKDLEEVETSDLVLALLNIYEDMCPHCYHVVDHELHNIGMVVKEC